MTKIKMWFKTQQKSKKKKKMKITNGLKKKIALSISWWELLYIQGRPMQDIIGRI